MPDSPPTIAYPYEYRAGPRFGPLKDTGPILTARLVSGSSNTLLCVEGVDPVSHKPHRVYVSRAGFEAWRLMSMHIQDALPSSTPAAREFLLTGLTDASFTAITADTAPSSHLANREGDQAREDRELLEHLAALEAEHTDMEESSEYPLSDDSPF